MRKILSMCFSSVVVLALIRPDAGAREPLRATPTAPVEYLQMTNPFGRQSEAIEEAKAIYKRACKKCHGADGKGRGSATRGMAVKPPDYTDTEFMNSRKDGQLLWIILNGSDPNTTEMTGFKGKLSEDDAWKLVLFIREFTAKP
jgi:mono/diheme cytochrome c family protein